MGKNYKILDFVSSKRRQPTREEYLNALEDTFGLNNEKENVKKVFNALGATYLRNLAKSLYKSKAYILLDELPADTELYESINKRYREDNDCETEVELEEKISTGINEYIDSMNLDKIKEKLQSTNFLYTVKNYIITPTKNFFLLKQLLSVHPDKNFSMTIGENKYDTGTDVLKTLQSIPDTFSGIARSFCSYAISKTDIGKQSDTEYKKYNTKVISLEKTTKSQENKILNDSSLSAEDKQNLLNSVRQASAQVADKLYEDYSKITQKIKEKLSNLEEKNNFSYETLRASQKLEEDIEDKKKQIVKANLKTLNPLKLPTKCKSISHVDYDFNTENDNRLVVDFEGRVQDSGLSKKLKKIIDGIIGDVEIRSEERCFSRPSRCAHFIRNAFLPVYKKNKPRKKPLFFIDSSGSMRTSSTPDNPFTSKTAMIAAFLRDNNRKISELHPRYFHFNSCPAKEFDVRELLPTAEGGNNMMFLSSLDRRGVNIIFTDGGFEDNDYLLLKKWVDEHKEYNVHWVCNDKTMTNVLKESCGDKPTHIVHFCEF